MLDTYAQHLARRNSKPATIRIRLYWVRRLAETCDPLTATSDELFEFLESYPGWTPSTRGTVTSSLRRFYAWTTATGRTTTNPAAELPIPLVPRTRSRIATDDVLVGALAGASAVDRAMLLLAAECGLRRSEVAGARIDDRDGEWLEVHGKGGRTRWVNLSPELVGALEALEATTARWGFYFPGMRPGQPVAPDTVWRHIRNLTGFNTHALRHRAGTTAYRRNGNDIRLAQELLGHANPAVTARYVHIERDDLRRASQSTRLAA